MNYKLLGGIVFLFVHFSGAAIQRDAIILADVSENIDDFFNQESIQKAAYGPILDNLVVSLSQESNIIFCTATLWNSFIASRMLIDDFLKESEKELKEKYGSNNLFNSEQKIEHFKKLVQEFGSKSWNKITTAQEREAIPFLMICYKTPFDEKEWRIMSAGKFWYVLIPKKYENRILQKSEQPSELSGKQVSENEVILGLKKLPALEDPLMPKKAIGELAKDKAAARIQAGKEFVTLLPKIFVTKRDVSNPLTLPNWYFFMNGHGTAARPKENVPSVIAGFNLDQFQQILLFFNNLIKTDFLFYDSCFSGGAHLLKPYERTWYYSLSEKDPGSTKADVYNYIIIASTVSTNLTRKSLSQFLYGNPRFSGSFESFFSEIHNYVYPAKNAKVAKLSNIIGEISSFKSNLKGYGMAPVIHYPEQNGFRSSILKIRS